MSNGGWISPLPEDIKVAFRVSWDAFSNNLKGIEMGAEAENYQKYIDYGITVTKLPDEDVAKLIKIRNEVMGELADENPLFKEIWLNQEAFVSSWREYKSWDSVTFESYKLAEE